MRSARLALLLVAVLAAPAVVEAASGPYWSVGQDGTLVVSGLPDILARPEVRPHLKTGLTTTFIVRVTASDETGSKVKGAGRADVRWELWDEVFLTASLGASGRARSEALPSFERLMAWWRGLALPVAAGLAPGGRWQVKVEVSVVPFSRSEQRDTQRWFSDTLGRPERPAPRPPGSDEDVEIDRGASLNGLLDLLIVTSIKRPNLATYVWTASPRASSRPPGGGGGSSRAELQDPPALLDPIAGEAGEGHGFPFSATGCTLSGTPCFLQRSLTIPSPRPCAGSFPSLDRCSTSSEFLSSSARR